VEGGSGGDDLGWDERKGMLNGMGVGQWKKQGGWTELVSS
jgi:hypothetical protein